MSQFCRDLATRGNRDLGKNGRHGVVGGLEELEGKDNYQGGRGGEKSQKVKRRKRTPGRQLHGVFVQFCTPATEQEVEDWKGRRRVGDEHVGGRDIWNASGTSLPVAWLLYDHLA